MKLELKHIAGYLPYGLKIKTVTSFELNISNVIGLSNVLLEVSDDYGRMFDIRNIKPILRPLSDLTKEIEVNGEKVNFSKLFFFIDEFDKMLGYTSVGEAQNFISNNPKELNYPLEFWEKLYEWHFDIHGLIEKGLAIDKNTLS